LCYQKVKDVARDITSAIKNTSITTIYIATDVQIEEDMRLLYDELAQENPEVLLINPTRTLSSSIQSDLTQDSPPNFLQDLVILSEADLFLGNCISSYSAFISRLRKWAKKPTLFLGNENVHRLADEL
jgi:peptide-O-fucosyltransferase